MPIVQSSALQVVNGAQSGSVTLSGVTAGNALVVTASIFSPTANDAPLIKDGSTKLTQVSAYTPGGNYSSAVVAWELNVAAGSHTITVQMTSAVTAAYYDYVVHEVSGLGSTQPSVSTTGTTTGSTLALSGATPSQSGCIIFTALADDGNASGSTGAATTPSGYTSLWQEMAGSSNQIGAAAYQVQSTAAPVSPSWTGLNSGGGAGFAGVAVAFAPSGGGGSNALTGTSQAIDAATGTLTNTAPSGSNALAGTAQEKAAASGTLGVTKSLAGTDAQQGAGSGTLTNAAPGINLSGAAAQKDAATATLSVSESLAGTSSAKESASGTLAVVSSNSSASVLAYASVAAPNSTSTTSPLITAGITTPASGSTIIVNLLTQSTSTAPVSNFSDSYGNTWTLVATNYYAGGTAANGEFPSYLLKCVNAKGGPNHTFQLTKNSVQDECTIYAVVLNGGDIGNWTANTTGTYSGTVTTSGVNSAVLSFWSPNDTGVAGYVDNYHAPSGWVQMANNNNAYNSMSGADAYLAPVANAGTVVTATWTADNTGGGINPGQCMYMVEVLASANPSNNALAGTAQELAAASGGLTVGVPLAAPSLQVQHATGAINVSAPLSGVASATQNANGTLTIAVPLASASVQAQNAAGAINVAVPISGYAAATQNADGSLTISLPLSAKAVQQAAASASLGITAPQAGASAQGQSASGSLTLNIGLSGVELQQATASAALTNTAAGVIALSGVSGVQQSGTGALSVRNNLAGASLQIGGAQGTPAITVPLSAASVSASRANGSLSVGISLSGASLQSALAQAALSVQAGQSAVSASQQVGSGLLTLKINLSAQDVQQVAATATLGNTTVTVFAADPRYYAAIPARSFYASIPARSFYAAYAP